MQNKYTIYVNESGDSGLSENSSKMFCLAAFIVNNSDRNVIVDQVNEITEKIRKDSAFFNTVHDKKIYICRKISQMPIISFGIISNKETLGDYTITEDWRYYNKNCQYLFELIGKYIYEKHRGWVDHEIIFEHKDNVEYQKMRRYISKIKDDAKKKKVSDFLNYIDEISIEAKKKDEVPALRIATFIAHTLYLSFNHYNAQDGVTDNRYLKELKNIFHCHEIKKNILNYGIKPVHELKELGLLEKNKEFLEGLKSD